MDSPYNDGYSQLHYKELYEELLNVGEKNFNKKMLNQRRKHLEEKILALTNELNVVKSELSVVN